ncbi:hypothetical protein BGX29_001770 [Mortierella sp. GBA35]|nr:hypothetical protein BGX29_001770 [Mortierella sp. GBA35]
MSVPSIAQIWIHPNQQQHSNLQEGYQHDASRRRRHHTAGSNGLFGVSAPARTGATSPTAERHDSAAIDDSDSIPYDPFAPSSSRPSSPPPVSPTPLSSFGGYSSLRRTPHDPSIYSQGDAPSRRQDYDFPHLEHLDELDDYNTYSEDNWSRRRPSYHHRGGTSADDENGQGDVEGDQEDLSSIHGHSPQQTSPTPLPKIPLFVLSVVIFSEPLTSTILFPFVYFMVTDFHITKNEDEIGFFCGLIASSFFFAQFCTSIFWGYMSDRYGRRPILLLGLCGSTIACIFFGLSKSLAWAVISRSMCGLLNGNVGVAKSMLGEIADSTNQSQAFSVFGFAWGIGMIVGPVLGGYLANPAKNFPEIFGDWEFFIKYPYFLPCFVAAMGSVVGFTVGYFFLKETKGMRGGVMVDIKDVNDGYYANNINSNHYQSGNDYHAVNHDDSDSNGLDEHFSDFAGSNKPAGMDAATSHGASELDIDLERQPLMLPPNATQAQQVKFSNRRGSGMDHSTQYGSMATLTFDNGPSSVPSYPQHSHTTTSARSTLSRRPVSARPSLFHQNSSASDAGLSRLGSSYADRPMSAGHPSIYAYNRSISTGQLLSVAEDPQGRQRMETIPADTVSLSHYGYTIDPAFLESHNRMSGYNPGRQSRMSVAPSQVFVLPPDPNNKDPNQPVQLLVIQQEAGLSPLSITTIVAYAMLALHSIVFEEVYTLYAVTPVASHGLGWNAMQLSTSLACMGIVQLVMQFVVYPKLERRFSAVWLFRCAQLLYCCVYLAFPLIRAFAVDESDTETGGQITRVRYMVLTGLVFKYLCSVFSYTSVMVMITNSSPAHLLGTVNGIGQTSASFMRAFGPALGGILWAWSLGNRLDFPFNYFFVFFLMGTIALLGFIHSFSIPPELGCKKF